MNNLVLFINSLLSYLLVFAVIVVVAGVAVFIGIKMRKNSDAKAAAEETEPTDGSAEDAVTE